MVRLSLVNLYLHGFADPKVEEYDTLTSEEKWNETADVILANPPFMSPKGGIKPHKRFSIQAKRSEVLFVDYMAEHLSSTGRAAIIVPEGIIFQSQTAYKQLRELLVKTALVAVVSLPAGCFNPYSGVKTSILILDKSVARRSNTIAFFKVENDGYGLGAQRRAIDRNDLPQVKAELAEYLQALRSGKPVDELQPTCGLIVTKEKIAKNVDCNLSGERYGEPSRARLSDYELRKLGDVCTIRTGKKDVNSGHENGEYPFFTCARKHTYSNEYSFDAEAILIAGNGDVGAVQYYSGKFEAYQRTYVLTDWVGIEGRYLYFLLSDRLKETVSKLKLGNTMPYIKLGMLTEFEIPLPPLKVQKEIVAEIEGYQKVINGARAVLDNYRPHIPIHPDWPVIPLGEICSVGGAITTDVNLALPYFGADSIESNTGKLLKSETAQAQRVNGPVYGFSGERLLYSKIRPYLNKLTVVDLRGYCSSDMYPLLPDNSKVLITYLATYMLSDTFNERIRGYYERASIPKINRSQLFETEIPLPPLATQQAIVAEIEAEQKLVAANRELITRFEKKIQATLARVWGEDEAPATPET